MKKSICLMAAVLFMAAGQVFGAPWTNFTDGGTYNINYLANNWVRLDYQTPGMQTTVNMLDGGSIGFYLATYQNSQANIYGGYVYNLAANDSSKVTMSGGSVGDSLYAHDSSQVTISGGSVAHGLSADNSSQVTMSGGSVELLYANDSSHVNWSGGIIAFDSYPIMLDGQAILTIIGSDFAINGNPFGYGEITSILGGGYSGESLRTLTGTLANGDIINNQFQIGDYASITLVPEPATLLLLGLGAVIARSKR
jgi:hypothetical protein